MTRKNDTFKLSSSSVSTLVSGSEYTAAQTGKWEKKKKIASVKYNQRGVSGPQKSFERSYVAAVSDNRADTLAPGPSFKSATQ